ncbi:MAG: hypothetical protein ABIA59_00740 [Candidatus Latescibacterota bacterium]
MKKEIRIVKTKRGFKEYTYLGCPLTRNRSAWCYRLCAPDGDGHGRCGRIAPHSLKSSIQMAIENYNKKKQKIHFERLENMYLSAASSDPHEPGIHVNQGTAEIVLSLSGDPGNKPPLVDHSFYFKAMTDASLYAINSVIEDALVIMVNFNTYLTHPAHNGELIVKGRFVGISGGNYLAEAVTTDTEGNEIARGNGAFTKSDISLSSTIGYE